ncbi:extracellular solute-binding protein [Paenibacillus sp. J2TS4]|uniref:extracellular solute-binding protein n=1 Tax=Paenibacillus sp. J2TS4 TaxID=2807194 RepID=UPI001B1FE5CB|nr:extracellular solute-binding protein [Paenibacillus sp. J2TS4]GIP33405.1 hypothetical protein J2TS4_26150 [Paenibacillus sp. J2TS4]
MNNKPGRQSFQERLDRLVGKLRTDILSGVRQPGSYLPSESMLAKQFQLSNKSVRRGLELLVEEGLIVKIDRVGSMVMETAQEKIRINFGLNPSLTSDFLMDELLLEFHRGNPGIQVRPITLNNFEHVQSAGEMMESGILDVVSFNGLQFQEMVESGLEPLLEPLSADDALYPIANEAFIHQGQLLAYPISFSPVVLCYNRAHFQEADLPEPDSYWTWDDLMDAAAKLSAKRGRHAIYFVPASENRYSVFLLQSGLEWRNNVQSEGTLDPQLANSLRTYSKLVNNHTIFPKYLAGDHEDQTIPLFKQQQVSMIVTTYFNLNEIKHLPLDYDLAPLPTLKTRDPQKTLLITIGAAVVSNSREKEAARKLVDFLISPEAQSIIREKTVSIPARKQVAEMSVDNREINRPSRYLMYRELFPSFYYHRDLGLPIKALTSFRKSLNAYWSNMIDEQELHKVLSQWMTEPRSR